MENRRIAIGYLRVSTLDQAVEGVSLGAQRDKIQAYCELMGLELVAVHADEGLSGKRADNRPGLKAALEAVAERKGVLVVYSLSRLARSTVDCIAIAQRLEKAGAELASINERIDTTSSIGKFFFTLMAALGQLERDQISDRTREALTFKKQNGQRVGRIPFGYDLAPDGKHLVANPTEQQAIETIVSLAQQRLSTRKIIAAIEAQGIRPKAAARWSPQAIANIINRAA